MNQKAKQSLADFVPGSIEGWRIRLDPMKETDAEDLLEVGRDERIWRFMARGPLTSEQDAREFIQQALAGQERGTDVPYVIRLKSNGTVIGSTRYLVIDPVNNSVEVGWLFIDPRQHRRYYVQEVCYMQIAHAFDVLGADRVWFKTDNRNVAAKKAMDSMGLKREGVLRKHLRVKDGYIRDSSIHSYISDEWPECGPRFREKVLERVNEDAQ